MIPVDLDPRKIDKPIVEGPDRRVCACGHLVRRHGAYGDCRLASRGGSTRCGCVTLRSMGVTRTPGRWNVADRELVTERTRMSRPAGHPFELAVRGGAHLDWAEGEPRCDRCFELAQEGVRFVTLDDGQTRVWCGCE